MWRPSPAGATTTIRTMAQILPEPCFGSAWTAFRPNNRIARPRRGHAGLVRLSEFDAGTWRVGKQIGLSDGLIAATALHHRLAVMTRNVSDFAPTGVQVVNPWPRQWRLRAPQGAR